MRRTKKHARVALGLALTAAGFLFAPQVSAQTLNRNASPETAPESTSDRMQRVSRENAASQDKKDKFRDARTNRITGSICVGCGGPVVPFNPGGEQAAKKKPAKHRAAKSAPTDPAQAEGASPD